MRRALLASVSVLAVLAAVPALAADLPSKMPVKAAPIAPAPRFSWTGCYIGGNIGYGWGQTGFADPTPNDYLVTGGGGGWSPVAFTADTSGVLGGGQIGCNYQLDPSWVVGIEGDISAASIKGTTHTPLWFDSPLESKTTWMASLTGRVGYAWNNWMVYAKGGAAWAHFDFFSTNYIGSWTASETPAGWTVGGGLEWAFANDWSAKLEYDYYDFGEHDVSFAGPPPPTTEHMTTRTMQAVTIGLNYHFRPY